MSYIIRITSGGTMKKHLVVAAVAVSALTGCALSAEEVAASESAVAAAASSSLTAASSSAAAASLSAAAESEAAVQASQDAELEQLQADLEAAQEEFEAALEGAVAGGTLGAEYADTEELLAAFEAAGGYCEDADFNDDPGTYSTSSVICGDNTILSIYPSQSAALENAELVYQLLLSTDVETSEWLVGENWVVNAPDSVLVQETMGGEFYTG
ncbi:hypothetical protein [Arthrobacter sp. KK5.5]|uniref:hypothetical protein n=1 Tax=Arthrobacter sp. KK5.5 TaxID=3373084 RepID=UPI003EE4902B